MRGLPSRVDPPQAGRRAWRERGCGPLGSRLAARQAPSRSRPDERAPGAGPPHPQPAPRAVPKPGQLRFGRQRAVPRHRPWHGPAAVRGPLRVLAQLGQRDQAVRDNRGARLDPHSYYKVRPGGAWGVVSSPACRRLGARWGLRRAPRLPRGAPSSACPRPTGWARTSSASSPGFPWTPTCSSCGRPSIPSSAPRSSWQCRWCAGAASVGRTAGPTEAVCPASGTPRRGQDRRPWRPHEGTSDACAAGTWSRELLRGMPCLHRHPASERNDDPLPSPCATTPRGSALN
jgi:hypothetical protein